MLDLAWSPDGSSLLSVGMEQTSYLWDAANVSRAALRFEDHKHFAQGAAWDPSARTLVTQSADRTCRRAASGFRVKGAKRSP